MVSEPASWEQTRRHLAQAWVQLPAGVYDDLRSYQDFLDHNELERATDALAKVCEGRMARGDFWMALADAAREMGLSA